MEQNKPDNAFISEPVDQEAIIAASIAAGAPKFNELITGDSNRPPSSDELTQWIFNGADESTSVTDVSKINGPGEPSDSVENVADPAGGAANFLGWPVDMLKDAQVSFRPAAVEQQGTDVSKPTEDGVDTVSPWPDNPDAVDESVHHVPLPNPTAEDLADPMFEAIWSAIKTWDVNVPQSYVGYCGATGSHVKVILESIRGMMFRPSTPEVVPAPAVEEIVPAAVVDCSSYLASYNAAAARLADLFRDIPADSNNRLVDKVDAFFPIQMVLVNDKFELIRSPSTGIISFTSPEAVMEYLLTLCQIRNYPGYSEAPADVREQWQKDVEQLSSYIFTGQFDAPPNSPEEIVFNEVAAALDMYLDIDGGVLQASPEMAMQVLTGARGLGEQWLVWFARWKKQVARDDMMS